MLICREFNKFFGEKVGELISKPGE